MAELRTKKMSCNLSLDWETIELLMQRSRDLGVGPSGLGNVLLRIGLKYYDNEKMRAWMRKLRDTEGVYVRGFEDGRKPPTSVFGKDNKFSKKESK
jgi:hypothetical protein